MKYRVIPVTHYQQNCSLIWCEATMRGALVDPGGDIERLLAAIAEEGVVLEQVLLTHGHLDHVGAARLLADQLGIPVIGPHQADAYWLERLSEQAMMFGFPPTEPFLPDRWLNDGDTVAVGKLPLEVIHCPGHTAGHVVFFEPTTPLAFVGDVLFKGSVGRSDLPGGNHQQLLDAIRQRLLPLGDGVAFVPGHGPLSTFGAERRSNPFIAD